MRLIFVGPPGSGKGTQARMVSEKIGVPQVSTGDLLRNAVAHGTALGRKAREYIEAGRLVPDDMMLSIVDIRIGESDCARGFVLDGFPRTLGQAIGFEEILGARGQAVDAAFLIDVSDDVVLGRLSKRRVCPRCQALYNLDADPPVAGDACDVCGTALVPRLDDAENVVRMRLAVYRSDTLPLIDYYESRGILRRIDGGPAIEEVFSSIMREISEVKRS